MNFLFASGLKYLYPLISLREKDKRICVKKRKMVFVICDDTLVSHTSQLPGEGGTVCSEKIRHVVTAHAKIELGVAGAVTLVAEKH